MPRTAPNCARYSIIGSWSNGRPVVTTMEALVVGNEAGTRAQEIEQHATVVASAWETHMMSRFTDNYSAAQLDYLDLDSLNGPTGTVFGSLPATGSQVGSSTVPQVAVLATKIIGGTTRGNRSGRFFLPPPAESQIDENGELIGAEFTALNTALQNFYDATTMLSVPPFISVANLVVVQWPSIEQAQPSKRVPDPDGVGVPVNVTDIVPAQITSTMRRRVRP